MKLVLLYYGSKNHYKWLAGLVKYLSSSGFKVIALQEHWSDILVRHIVPHCHHIFIWNGEGRRAKYLISVAAQLNVKTSIVEVGYFPQKEYFILDRKGINAHSELIEDDLSWVGETEFSALEKLRKEYNNGIGYSGKDAYVFVPLQLDHDTNIKLHAPVKTMQEFITLAENKFSNEKILIKKHPLDSGNYSVGKNSKFIEKGDLLNLMINAKQVFGINSTALLEAALLKIPVTSIGAGFLKTHAANMEKLLAALSDKQIRIDATDMSYWLKKYTDFYEIDREKEISLPLYFYLKMMNTTLIRKILRSYEKRTK